MSGPTISDDGPWTLGVKIGLPFVGLGVLVFFAIFLVAWVNRKDSYNGDIAWFFVFATPVALLLYLGGMLWCYWPLDSAYHQYRPVTGDVANISSRIVSNDDGSVDQKFAVTFAGSPQQYAINDTRAALVKRGDRITISCIRSFEYGSEDGYDCKWGRP